MAGVPASSHGLPLSGGTLSGPLVINDPSAADTPLDVTGGSVAVGGTRLQIDTSGELLLNGLGGNPAAVVLADDTGSGDTCVMGSNTGLTIKGDSSVVSARSHASALIFSSLVPLGLKTRQGKTGALSTVALVSGAGTQISTTLDCATLTPVTFNPGAATTATCTIAISPDNNTYTTLGVETVPAGVALDGTVHVLSVYVPAGWYLKLTVNAQAVLGTTTYY